ncbi:carbohydrate ABC transporter permease [Ruminococcus sp. 5_1_39BFAA]|uniref:carbohydrate ABC transporter permease n=1 Tax=Ruminococcus sp. 5_1_39BFAA TaxID=457412 RepID=UPI003562C72E
MRRLNTKAAGNIGKMHKRRKVNAGSIVLRAALVILALAFVYPVFFSFLTSTKSLTEFYQNRWGIPEVWQFANYGAAWVKGRIGEYFLNSLIYCFLTVLFLEIFAVMAAYALSRLHVPHVELIIGFLFICQLLPNETVIIPLYLMMSRLHLLKLMYVPLIVANVGWALSGTIIVMKNFFDTLPGELLEAARIDGCTETKSMFHIVLPLMKGAIATCVVMNFTAVWGELMWAQIATMTTDKGIPLTVGLLNFQSAYGTEWPLLCAAIIVVVIPLYVLFIFLQKYFVASLTAGAVKG